MSGTDSIRIAPSTGSQRWMQASLSQKLLLTTGAILLCASLVFLLLILGTYRSQLERERAQASNAINRLLQSSLENAMLKRDLDGLRDIVTRLGQQKGIRGVMIVNPQGEVRFASRPELLGTFPSVIPESDAPSTRFVVDRHGQEVLRSINPVQNKLPCATCHGSVASNPTNGILVVDYDASEIKTQARTTALMLIGSGAAVTALVLLGVAWCIRRYVLRPVEHLAQVSRRLANGETDARVDIEGADELGQLGSTFNEMAQDLQRSLHELHDKEVFLQALVDAVPDGIRIIDDQFNVLLTNRAYREQLGLSAQAAQAMPCYASSHGRKEPCPPTWTTCPVHELRIKPRALKTLHNHVHSDGRHFPVEVFAAPMLTGGSEAGTLVVESIRDIDKAMAFSHEQHLAEMGRLAAGVAHELNNPMASIRLAVQATLRRTLETDRALDVGEVRRYLQLVNDEIDQCLEVSERLLKLARTPSRDPQLVAIAPAVHDTCSLLHSHAEECGVRVFEILSDDAMRVLATDSEIRMVVLNLIQNAFHAMPDGGELRIRGARRDGRVEVEFDDTGVGIPARNRPHIFEPFFSERADGVRGTGLGLSICRSIMLRYNGWIEVVDDSLPGTRLRISLPDPDFKQ